MKRAAVALAAGLCCPLLASIITEQNNLYTEPPKYATFTNGINSQWIPYGTYTGGYGSPEYLRVSSNLAGVVVSVFDGYRERASIPNNNRPSDLGGYRYTVIPGDPGVWRVGIDTGEFLESATNQTLRIYDRLNEDNFIIYGQWDSSNYYYSTYAGKIEENLARYGSGYNDGLASSFGSRRLESMTSDAEPPISDEWSSDIPFDASQVDNWVNVYPTYSACSNDVSFWPLMVPEGSTDLYEFQRQHIIEWMYPSHLVDVWDDGTDMSDVWQAVTDLYGRLLYRPLRNGSSGLILEDVLGYDTGWSYSENPTNNFYKHWRNGTRRLDWNRLGILCQLERQMETTYTARQEEDYALRFMRQDGHNSKTQLAQPPTFSFWIKNDPLMGPDGNWVVTNVNMSSLSFSTITNDLFVTTNSIGHCYPTARAETTMTGNMRAVGGHDDLWLEKNTLTSFIQGEVTALAALGCTDGNIFIALPLEVSFPAYTLSGCFVMRLNSGTCDYYSNDGQNYLHFDRSGRVVKSWILEDGEYTASDVNVFKTYDKHAELMYTSTPATNLVWDDAWPAAKIFTTNGWVKSARVPTIETIISVTNAPRWITEDTTPMSYRSLVEDPKSSNSLERVFRMSPESATVCMSINALRNSRIASAAALNHQVHLKFQERSGRSVDAFAAEAARLLGSDEAFIDNHMTNFTGHAEVKTIANGILVEVDTTGNIHGVYGYDGETQPWPLTETQGAYLAGYISFGFEDAYSGKPLAPIRVDGHQDQLIKKLFKFKNLRDPNL